METTKVVLAQPTSKSLRSTIPATIARQFGIDVGTETGWDVEARDNRLVLVVKVITAPLVAASSTPTASNTTSKGKGEKTARGRMLCKQERNGE